MCCFNIIIGTRLFKDMFWGEAEPIAITVLKRKPETQVGTIRNVRFHNILCESENGILIYGEDPGHIENIRFDNVSLHLRRRTSHELGIHDLRPTIGPTCTRAGLTYVHAHNINRVRFRDCCWTSELPVQPCIAENCTDFSADNGDGLC